MVAYFGVKVKRIRKGRIGAGLRGVGDEGKCVVGVGFIGCQGKWAGFVGYRCCVVGMRGVARG